METFKRFINEKREQMGEVLELSKIKDYKNNNITYKVQKMLIVRNLYELNFEIKEETKKNENKIIKNIQM